MAKKLAEIKTKSSEETFEIGYKIGSKCNGGEIIALSGELGAGKTHLIKGIARGLGIEKIITSPTFVVSQTYLSGRIPFVHCDLYRISDFSELEDMGWYDFISSGSVIAVEWAEKIKDYIMEEKVLWVEIEMEDENLRLIKFFSDSYDVRYLIDFILENRC